MEAGSGKDSGAGTQLFISNFVITALEEMRHMLAAASSKFPSERYFDERVVLSAEEDSIYRRSAVKRGTSKASDDGGLGGEARREEHEEHHERHADTHVHRKRDARITDAHGNEVTVERRVAALERKARPPRPVPAPAPRASARPPRARFWACPRARHLAGRGGARAVGGACKVAHLALALDIINFLRTFLI